MKKKVLSLNFFSISLLFCFTSCKVASKTELLYINVLTLKNEIAEIDKTLSWNKELEPQRLTSKSDLFSGSVNSQIEKNVELFKIINKNVAVYPEFEGFGSLNDSSVKADLYQTIEKLFLSISNNIYNGPETYFDSNYLYNYVFFREDLKEGWQKYFHKDFTHIVDYKEKDDSQKEMLFSKWIIGEPFFSEEIIQIPLRLYCKYGTIDVTLYLNRQKSNAVNLITIDRWKKV